MKRSRHGGYLPLIVGVTALLVAFATVSLPLYITSEPTAEQAVQGAWQRARQVGLYRFATELEQTTYPAPSLANVGRSSRTDTLHIEGQIDLPERALLMSLWQGGGNVLDSRDGVEVRVEGDQSYGRAIGGEWQTIDSFADAFAPGNDLMAYLAGASHLERVAAERSTASSYSRYSFDVDGPAFARYLRDQLERDLAQKGALPAGLSLDSSNIYRGMTGQGQVWIDERGLPLRLTVHVVYPQQQNGERVEADIKTDFSGFPPTVEAKSPVARWIGALSGLSWIPRTPRDWQQAGAQAGMILGLVGLLYVLITQAKSRLVYAALVLSIIVSMVAAPLLESQQAAAFFEKQTARQGEFDQHLKEQTAARDLKEQLTTSNWDPQRNPLDNAPQTLPASAALRAQPVAASPLVATLRASQQAASDNAATTCTDDQKTKDTDKDGLTDCDELTAYHTNPYDPDSDHDGLNDGVEVLRLGTNANSADSDSDSVSDWAEVMGFQDVNSKWWYLDPLNADTNNDGQIDSDECPARKDIRWVNGTTTVITQTVAGQIGSIASGQVCRDTDRDGTPDAFDLDDDGDGVPDKMDLSPLSAAGRAAPFTRDNPFNLVVNNLSRKTTDPNAYYPVLVDLQLRPVVTDHLTYALNVLDWPSGDEHGQIQRRSGNNSTFAASLTPSEIATDPSAQNGDMRLIPMLEIELSGDNAPFPLTTARTTLQMQGMDTAWTNTSQPPTFTTWTSATINLAQVVSDTRIDFQFWGSVTTMDSVEIYTGTCEKGGTLARRFNNVANGTQTLTNTNLLRLADGEHAIVLNKQDHTSACALLGNIPRGKYTNQYLMIDQSPLKPYGITVRDKDKNGTLVAYAPLNVVPDETGGGRVAFSTRMLYQPQTNSLGNAQKVRVAWLVQMLADSCKPAPGGVSDSDAQKWCEYSASWDLDNAQVVHTYYDDWYLTGLNVREDRGLNVAVAWEDPSTDTAQERQFSGWLWLLARGLEDVFVTGRDCYSLDATGNCVRNNIRDLGVFTATDGITVADSTIAGRFDSPLAPSVTITDRLGIPTTATLHVANFSYPNQDYVADIMMTQTAKVLNDNFASYVTAGSDAPTLLFAREERYRATNLDVADSATITGTTTILDMAEAKHRVETLGTLNWAPFRYRNGRWQSYPADEYWDLMGARFRQIFPQDPTLPAADGEDIARGQVMVAQSFYLSMLQGRVGRLDIDRVDAAVDVAIADVKITDSLAGKAVKGVGGIVKVIVPMIAEEIFMKYDYMAWEIANAISYYGRPPTSAQLALRAIGRGIKDFASGKADLAKGMFAKLRSLSTAKKVGAAIGGIAVAVVAVGVVGLLLAGYFLKDKAAQFIVSNAANMILAAVSITLAVKTAVQFATRTLEALSSAAVRAGVVGMIIGAVVTFAAFVATMASAHVQFASMTFNAALAGAIASTITAGIMFAISLIPVVGQVIAAIIGAIDALVVAICGAFNLGSTKVGQWLCGGISGLVSKAISWLIYGSTIMVDFEKQDRLQFGRFDQTFVYPERGVSVGSTIKYTTTVANSINLSKIPIDWKAQEYKAQWSDDNLKRSRFLYAWQTAAADVHDGLALDQGASPWQSSTGTRPFSMTTAVASTTPITLTEAGLNRPASLYLSEGYAVPAQECFGLPNIPLIMLGWPPYIPNITLIPVCTIRTQSATNNMYLGTYFAFDVFPATLDEFYRPVLKNGGYSLAWGQVGDVTLGRQKDFDGDGLLSQADGGSDPDDTKWDTDGDGLSDSFELQHGSDPTKYDTDGDGLNDAVEFRLGTDPTRVDTDGDGLTDKQEQEGWDIVYALDANGNPLRAHVTSDPLSPDTDGDGLTDFQEKTYGFNPRLADNRPVLKLQAQVREAGAPGLLLRFEDAPGSQIFADQSGSGNPATCVVGVCPASVGGKFGSALQFNGEYLVITDTPSLELSTFSIGAWVMPTALKADKQPLIVKEDSAGGQSNYDLYIRPNSMQVGITFANSVCTSGVLMFSAGSLTQNQWNHVMATYDGSSIRLYLNGALDSSGIAPTGACHSNQPVMIGRGLSGSRYFSGRMDEVVIFDRALASNEVASVRAARYNPNDMFVRPGGALQYQASVANLLDDRYAQGLFSLNATGALAAAGNVPPTAFVLPPQTTADMSGAVQVISPTASAAVSLTQVAGAIITDWREQSGQAKLWLPLNEPVTATTFLDYSGSVPPNDGTCSPSSCPARQAAGYLDYGLSFSGTQYVTLPDTAKLGLKDSSFSVAGWVKASSLPSGYQTILGTDNIGANAGLYLAISSTRPYLGYDGNDLVSHYALAADTWYHLVFRYDKSIGQQAIFVNGLLRDQRNGAPAFAPLEGVLGTGSATAYLGRSQGSHYFNGVMDDVRVFDRALAPEEIAALYNQPVLRLQLEPPLAPSPIARTILADSSGMGNSASCVSVECPTRASGVSGSAARFSGSNSLGVGPSPSLDLSDGQFTLAAWVKPDPQPEPMNPACPFSTGYYLGTVPVPTGGCVDWEGWADPASGLMIDVLEPVGGYTHFYSGTFSFPAGNYNFTVRSGEHGYVRLFVDGNEVANAHPWHDAASYIETWDTTSSNLQYYLSAGVHQLRIESTHHALYTNLVQFTFSPPYAQGILGEQSGARYAYPTLQTVGRQVRVGFGTGSEWVSRTTTDTVLTANAWNHVVATYNGNELILYVNNTRVGSWNLAGARPSHSNILGVGTSARLGSVWMDRLHVYDAFPGDSGLWTANFSLKWNGSLCHPTPTTDCKWDGLYDGDNVDVLDAESVGTHSTLEAVRRYLSTNHTLCLKSSSGSETCQDEYEFNSNKPGLRYMALNDPDANMRLYLGDDTHWAYYNNAMPFRGSMDEVSIYKRPLSPEEINELYKPAGAALHLRLDDPPGSQSLENAVDVSKQSNAFCAGLACPTTGVNGRINQAASFDGVRNVLSTTTTVSQMTGGGGATMMAWVKPASSSNGDHHLISTDNGNGDWSLLRNGGVWKISTGQGHSFTTTATVDVSQWQHVAAVFDPAQGMKFYKNGSLVSGPITLYYDASSGAVAIGARADGGAYLDGLVDDVRVFNRPLTDADIQAYYKAAPQFLLHLDEPFGSTLFADASANTTGGTCSGAACPKAGEAIWGKVGTGAEFDGVNNALSVTNASALDVISFTVGAWVMPTQIITGGWQSLIAKTSNSTDHNYGLFINPNGMTATLSFWPNCTAGQEQYVQSAAPLVQNQWNHVMGTYDGAQLKLYVNGTLQGSQAVTGLGCAYSAEPLRIGGGISQLRWSGGTAPVKPFVGRLDEVALYDHALTGFEVRDIFLYQGRWVQERRSQTIIVDNDAPASALLSDSSFKKSQGEQLHIEARDRTSRVAMVELGVNGVFTAAPPCGSSGDGAAWCPYFQPSGDGRYQLQTRATDVLGNVEVPTRTYTVYVDSVPPTVTLPSSGLVAAYPHPSQQDAWVVHLSGTVADPQLPGAFAGSGVQTDSVKVALFTPEGAPVGMDTRATVTTGGSWTVDYSLAHRYSTGAYTVKVTASDNMGNAATTAWTVQVDASAPSADLDATKAPTTTITGTTRLQGNVIELPALPGTLLAMHLEESAGATAFSDSSGEAHTGACAGAACPTAGVTGKYGRALQFDPQGASGSGGDKFVTIPHSSLNEMRNNLTVAAWINPTQLSGIRRIVATARTQSNNGFGLGVNGTDLSFSAFGVKDYALAGTGLQTNRWTHVAAAMGDDNAVRFYVDGVYRGVVTGTVPVNADTDDALLLGATTVVSSAITTERFNGAIDELTILGRALSVEEVRALAQAQVLGVDKAQIAFAPSLPGSTFYNQAPLPGQAFYLPFEDQPDDAAGLSFADVSGNNRTGRCSGLSCPSTGQIGHNGSAVRFDRGDAVYLGHLPVNELHGSFTWMAWVNPDQVVSSTSSVQWVMATSAYNFGLAGSGLRFSTNACTYDTAGVTLSSGVWTHIAAVMNPDYSVTFYVNGIQKNTVACGTAPSPDYGYSFMLGNQVWNQWDHSYIGLMDDARAFARALSAEEIKSIYLGSEPVLALPFDGVVLNAGYAVGSNSLADASGWQQSAALTTGAGDTVNKSVSGAVGANALALDGTDDYVSVADSPSLGLGTFSVGAWAMPTLQKSDWQPLITKENNTGLQRNYGLFIKPNSMKVYFSFQAGDCSTWRSYESAGSLALNQWNHVMATYDGAQIKLYLNGALDGSVNITGTTCLNNQPVKIGREVAAFAAFKGSLDDVRIYPRALSPLEVKALQLSAWQPVWLAQRGTGVNMTTWAYTAPVGLEATYQVNVQGADMAGHTDGSGQLLWRGDVDTLAPRVSLVTQTIGSRIRYTAVAQDFNLSEQGFLSPCGIGTVMSRQYYDSPWYAGLSGQTRGTNRRLYQLTAVCDVSVGANPVGEIGAYDTPGNARDVVISGTHAYVADGPSGLAVVDISNPYAPRLVGRWWAPGSAWATAEAYRVALYGNYAFVAAGTAGLRMMDVSNPATPTEVWSFSTVGRAVDVAIGRTQYGPALFMADDGFGLDSFDLSGGTPSQFGVCTDCYGSPHSADADGENVYLVTNDQPRLLKIMNYHDPQAAFIVGQLQMPYNVQDVVVSGTYAYVADDLTGLRILDVTQPMTPTEVGSLNTAGAAFDVALTDHYAVVADGWNGAVMLDVSNPMTPTLAATYPTRFAYGVAASGIYAYVADSWNGLRVINLISPVSSGRMAACDTAGNCATATITSGVQSLSAQSLARSLAAAASGGDAPNLDVSIANVPPVLTSGDPITITGEARAITSSLRALTVTIDSVTLYTNTWANGAATQTVWLAPWTPPGDGPRSIEAAMIAWDGNTTSQVLAFTVDALPPDITIAPLVITTTLYHAPRALDVTGLVTDAGGIASVQVLGWQDNLAFYDASVAGNDWFFTRYLGGKPLPDGATFTVTARVTDVAGRTKLVTETLVADVMPPAPPLALTVTSDAGPVARGGVIRTSSPTLTVTWTPGSDGSGLGDYLVRWTAQATDTVTSTLTAHNPAGLLSDQYVPGEAQKVSVEVASQDVYGHVTWRDFGPVYVDGPLTPDYIDLAGFRNLSSLYRGWMESGCSLVGVDRRANQNAASGSVARAEQKLYTTWDGDALRLSWTGANWNTDGDLFIYLDTQPGGSITAYNPYTASASTVIYMPGVTPTSTVNAMAADYMVWAQGATATLLQWSGSAWVSTTLLSSAQSRFDPALNSGQTDLYVPFNLIGITDPASAALDMVAFASERPSQSDGTDALRLWAVMPGANPVNSPRVGQTASYAGDLQIFALAHRYHWSSVGDGVCPNGAYPDSDLSVSLSAQPVGKAYSFLGDDLFWLWNMLLGDKPGDVSSFLPFASTSQPPLGDQQTIVFSIHYRNRGTVTATNVLADVSSLYALRLPLGTHLPAEFRDHQVVSLGDIGPGDEGSVTFAGVVDRTTAGDYYTVCTASQPDYACADYLGLASVRVLIFDDAHSPAGPPLDWLWVDHKVDLFAPEFFGVQQPEYVLAADVNTVRGYAFDDAGVPTMMLKIQGGATLLCPDGTPDDGQWTCALDATGRSDGDVINVQLQATNGSGQASVLTDTQPFVVDTLPPTLTLDPAVSQVTATGTPSVVQASSYKIAGQVSDNHGLGHVEACVDDAPCAPADLELTGGDTAHIYDDVPGVPIAINNTTTCGGSAIVRTFNVSDSFVLGEVSVGLNVQHPQRNDVHVELESPLGARVRLLYNDGVPDARFANYDVLLNDAATSAYNVGHDDDPSAPYFDRQARPYQPLRSFNGQTANGSWKLTICDTNPSADDGLYNRGRLVLKPRDTAARTGNWSFTVFNAERLDSVPQTVSMYGVDLVGNRAAPPLVINVTVDNVPPVITVTSAMNSVLLTPTVTVLTGRVSDGGPLGSVFVLVQAPDGTTYSELTAMHDGVWQYNLHPVSGGRYRLWVNAVDAAGNAAQAGPFDVFVKVSLQTFMPLVMRNYVSAPDLVVSDLVVTSGSAQVVIWNRGTAPVRDEFWVDVYVAPRTAPTGVNQTWQQLGTQGLTWGVTADALPALVPGGALTLTVGDAYYWPSLSQVAWPLVAGTPVYAQVDSADAGTTYGAVLETHEMTGDAYNNILGPIYSTSAASAAPAVVSGQAGPAAEDSRLPRRP